MHLILRKRKNIPSLTPCSTMYQQDCFYDLYTKRFFFFHLYQEGTYFQLWVYLTYTYDSHCLLNSRNIQKADSICKKVQCIAVIFLQTSWENDVLDSTNKKFTIAYSIQDLIFMQRIHNSARPNNVHLSLRYQKNVVLTFLLHTLSYPVSVVV